MDKLDLILQKIESIDGRLDRLENRIYPSISIIAENHLDLYRHLKTVFDFRPSHDALEIRVSALEFSMGRVKEVIQNLKSA